MAACGVCGALNREPGGLGSRSGAALSPSVTLGCDRPVSDLLSPLVDGVGGPLGRDLETPPSGVWAGGQGLRWWPLVVGGRGSSEN